MPTESIIFLGLCEKVQEAPDGHPDFRKHNILGLKNTVLSPIFPVVLAGFSLAFSIRCPKDPYSVKLRGINPDGQEAFSIEFSLAYEKHGTRREASSPQPLTQTRISVVASEDSPSWSFITFPVPDKSAIRLPGLLKITATIDEEELNIGQVRFLHTKPQPLTADRLDAIRSNPEAAKSVRYALGCTHCFEEVRAYAGIDRNPDTEKNGWTWQHDLPPKFLCSCGKTTLDLTYIRDGLHGLLGTIYTVGEEVEFTRLYERNSLDLKQVNKD